MKRIFSTIAATIAAFFVSNAAGPAPTTVAHPVWSHNAVIYEINTRQYTPDGTFKAFAKELPRLRDLGVDILWFMPIHPISEVNRKGELGSYYAVADYKGVNPEFGSLADFKALVELAHKSGMKVILDWVPNHTGCDHPWVKEHPDYYARNDKNEMFGPFDWTDVYKLDYSNPATRQAMADAMEFWLREVGIDGFRCDVAGQVPCDFWNEVRPRLEAAAGRPVFMLAEDSQPTLVEHAFDMDYNWPMKDLFSAIAATSGQYTFDTSHKFDTHRANAIDSLVEQQQRTFAPGCYLMNMTSNHDLNSWEGTEFERLGILAPAFAVIAHTLPGMPLIYTGQETGLNRAFEFFKKDIAPDWEPRNDYFSFYKKLNALKHNRLELTAGFTGGSYTPVKITDSPDVVAYSRERNGKGTFVAANLGKENVAISTPASIKAWSDKTDAFTDTEIDSLSAVLAPGQYIIFTYNAK